jgi:hypothetical protein
MRLNTLPLFVFLERGSCQKTNHTPTRRTAQFNNLIDDLLRRPRSVTAQRQLFLSEALPA